MAAGAAAAALLSLTACSGGGSSDASEAGGDAPATVSERAQPAEGGADAAVSAGGGSEADGAKRVTLQAELFIRTGTVEVVVKDLDVTREELDRLVQRYGGHVAEEQTSNDDEGSRRSSRLTLRIPSDSFATVMGSFDELGAVRSTTTREEDVTTEVIDVASRIRTQEVSLRRLRGFLGQARTVQAIIRLESEIARREADLASLRAQRDYLDDQTSLSTIQLSLREAAPEEPPVEDDPLAGAGFLAGLSSGWHALLDVLLVIGTVVGAAIPFVVVLALVGLPLSVVIVRARGRSAARADQGPSTA